MRWLGLALILISTPAWAETRTGSALVVDGTARPLLGRRSPRMEPSTGLIRRRLGGLRPERGPGRSRILPTGDGSILDSDQCPLRAVLLRDVLNMIRLGERKFADASQRLLGHEPVPPDRPVNLVGPSILAVIARPAGVPVAHLVVDPVKARTSE
jgi:hypothetical protein